MSAHNAHAHRAMSSTDAVTLPTEMLSFVLRHGELSKVGLRLGQLAVQGLPVVSTPSFVVPTSRGVVPHVTQDLMSKVTRVPAVYIGLEDCKRNIQPPRHKLTEHPAYHG